MSEISLKPAGRTRKLSSKVKISPGRKSLDAELYGLGRTLRHLQPPGGPESGIFDAFLKPDQKIRLRRKPNNYLKSDVFQDPLSSPPRPITPEKETTFYKIFGGTPPRISYRSSNSIKSSVFDSIAPKQVPKLKKYVKKNPITGEACGGEPKKLKPLTVRNPITFEGIVDRYIRSRYTVPPGGRSSIKLEYSEKF